MQSKQAMLLPYFNKQQQKEQQQLAANNWLQMVPESRRAEIEAKYEQLAHRLKPDLDGLPQWMTVPISNKSYQITHPAILLADWKNAMKMP